MFHTWNGIDSSTPMTQLVLLITFPPFSSLIYMIQVSVTSDIQFSCVCCKTVKTISSHILVMWGKFNKCKVLWGNKSWKVVLKPWLDISRKLDSHVLWPGMSFELDYKCSTSENYQGVENSQDRCCLFKCWSWIHKYIYTE